MKVLTILDVVVTLIAIVVMFNVYGIIATLFLVLAAIPSIFR